MDAVKLVKGPLADFNLMVLILNKLLRNKLGRVQNRKEKEIFLYLSGLLISYQGFCVYLNILCCLIIYSELNHFIATLGIDRPLFIC